MSLKGKHAFITGCGKRLGRSMAEELLKHGMDISAHYRNSQKEVHELQEWAQTNGLGQVLPIPADLRSSEAIKRAVEAATQNLGPIDLLINSASDFYPTPIGSVTTEIWDSLFELNLRAPFFLTQQIVKTMKPGANVIFISDTHATKPIAKYAPYCATKAALVSLSRSLAKELSPDIRVNSISPGTLLAQHGATQEETTRAAQRTLLGRIGCPNDLIQGLLFLIRSSYITGFDLVIDGGRGLL